MSLLPWFHISLTVIIQWGASESSRSPNIQSPWPQVETTQVGTLNFYEILKAEKLVLTVEAVKKLEEVYA